MFHQIIDTSLTAATPTNTVGNVLQFMDDDDVKHIVVFREKTFLGLLAKKDLLECEETEIIENCFDSLMPLFVFENDHFAKALRIMADKQLDILPILNSNNEFVGNILATNLLFQLAQFVGADQLGGLIVLEMEGRNFAFNEIARLIETNDATIMHMNTHINPESGLMLVTIKINKQELSAVIATLQRYEYNVIAYYGEESYENELQNNYNHLLHYLNI